MTSSESGYEGRVPSLVMRPAQRPRRYLVGAALGCIAVCLVAVQARNLLSFSQWYTDEDQTLLWFAGRGLIHFHLYSPNVLGANYNTVFEALPGAVMHLAGLALRLASPLGVALMVTVGWLLLTAAAYIRGEFVSAALALALPVCLSVPYLLSYDQLKGVQTGDLLAAGAIAVSIVIRHPWRRLGVAVCLAGVAFVWDNATVIATGPALAAAVGADFTILRERSGRTIVALLAGCFLTVALVAINHIWYGAHPGYVVSPPVDTSLEPSVLWDHLIHPGPLFGAYAPELLRSAWLAIAWIVAALGFGTAVACRTRRIGPGLAALAFGVILLIVLSVADTQANFQPDIYLIGARFMFLMPMGAWVVTHHALVALHDSPRDVNSEGPSRRWRISSTAVVGAIAVFAVASTAVAQMGFRSQVRPLIAYGESTKSGVQMQDASGLLADCKTVTRIYGRSRSQILVSLDQPFAYGCAAQNGMNTLYPPYDRRPWLVEAALARPVDRILLWGGINCQPLTPLSPKVGVCTPLPDGAELFVTPPRPVAETLAMMGVDVHRPERLPAVATQ